MRIGITPAALLRAPWHRFDWNEMKIFDIIFIVRWYRASNLEGLYHSCLNEALFHFSNCACEIRPSHALDLAFFD